MKIKNGKFQLFANLKHDIRKNFHINVAFKFERKSI